MLLHAGHCSGTANITLPPSTLPSFVHLNLTCNVISIQQGAVLEVFERAIMAFSRPTDPDHETGDQQVCGWVMPVSSTTAARVHVGRQGVPQACFKQRWSGLITAQQQHGMRRCWPERKS